MKNRFKDKIVLLLGATGGIGSALTEEIISEDGILVAVSKNETKLQELENKYKKNFYSVKADVTNGNDLQNVSNFIEEKFQRLDSVIHSVGSIILRSIPALSEEQFKDCLELNLVSPFITIKTFLPFFLKEKKGSFVFTSSVAARTGLQNHEAISAAKGGLEAMIRSASMTYAKKGIRFNSVAMGLVDTPLANFITKSESSLNASKSMHPMDRIGSAKDILQGILYLASDDSSWVTGTVLPIDGGMSAGK